MNLEEVKSIFVLAGISVKRIHQIENDYFPSAYVEARAANPWWLIETPSGCIRIGWRKRVIHIDWTSLDIRAIITDDDVTKEPDMVHAYSVPKAVEYLTALQVIIDSRRPHG